MGECEVAKRNPNERQVKELTLSLSLSLSLYHSLECKGVGAQERGGAGAQEREGAEVQGCEGRGGARMQGLAHYLVTLFTAFLCCRHIGHEFSASLKAAKVQLLFSCVRLLTCVQL